MRKIAVFVTIVVVLVAVTALILRYGAPDTSDSGILRIGVILPQTGYSAFIGQSVRKGIDLAHGQYTASGETPSIDLIYEDSGGDVNQAVSAYHKLTSVDKVAAIICVSTGAKALIPLADRDEIVLFCTAVSASDIATQSPWSFRFFINADVDASMMARYAVQRCDYKNLAVIYINDEMGQSYNKVFSSVAEELGATIVASEGFGFDVVDFKPILAKIAARNPDAIYLQAYNNSIGRIPVQMREIGMDICVLSVGTISQPEIMEQAGSAIEGVVYTTTAFNTFAPETKELADFVEAYSSKYNAPPIFFEVFGYDTFLMLKTAAQEGGTSADAIQAGVLSIQGLRGAAGEISMDRNGEVIFPVILRQIKDGQWAPLDD